MPRRADGIVQALKDAGVATVFGIPSVHNISLYEALRHERSIRHIVCRHEAAATHMADGYARASGSLGSLGKLLTGVNDHDQHRGRQDR